MFKPFRRYPEDYNLSYSNLNKIKDNIWQVDIISTNKYSANMFKRIVSSQIPIYGIGSVLVENNTGYIADEFIAMRLGLIPIKSNININKSIKYLDIESDENGDNFGSFSLNVECSKNSQRPVVVKSSDLIPDSYPPDFEVLDDNITICKLLPGQSLHLCAVVQIGSGSFDTFGQNCRNHPKWNAVCNCIFIEENNENNCLLPEKYNIRSSPEKYNICSSENIKTYKLEIELLGNVDSSYILETALQIYRDRYKNNYD